MDGTLNRGRQRPFANKREQSQAKLWRLPNKMEAMYRPWQAVETKTCWTSKTLNVLWHQKVKKSRIWFLLCLKETFHYANPNLCSVREPRLPLFITTGVDVEVNTVIPFISCIVRIQIQFLFEIKNFKAQLPNALQCGSWLPLSLINSLEKRYRT